MTATVGGLLTRIDTAAEVVFAPSLSVATAVIECVPTAAVAQLKAYTPPARTPGPKSVAPSKNSTPATEPSESWAEAERATGGPGCVTAPAAGPVTETDGGASTRKDVGADVVFAPSLSVATAVIACVPVAAPVQLNE